MGETRITIALDAQEADALVRIAEDSLRHPREQMRALLRAEAQRRGLWTAVNDAPMPASTPSAADRVRGAVGP